MTIRRLFSLFVVLTVPACSSLSERAFSRPVISVRGVTVHSVGLTGGSLDVALHITNPNPYPLPIQRATYRFVLSDSTEVGSGPSAAAFTLAFADGSLARAELLESGPGRVMRVESYDTAAGTAIPVRLWTVRGGPEPDGELRLGPPLR